MEEMEEMDGRVCQKKLFGMKKKNHMLKQYLKELTEVLIIVVVVVVLYLKENKQKVAMVVILILQVKV